MNAPPRPSPRAPLGPPGPRPAPPPTTNTRPPRPAPGALPPSPPWPSPVGAARRPDGAPDARRAARAAAAALVAALARGARLARRPALGAAPLVAALAAAPAGCRREPEGELFGVRLGLSARDTRERFRPAGEGTWVMRTEPAPALEWSASAPGATPRRASFEFHQGMLVAARYELASDAPAAKGRSLEVTPATVVARQPGEGGGVRVVVISRACPEHADEVRRLVGGAAGS